MSVDNTKLGYCYSAALHAIVAVAMFAYAFINTLFPKEKHEENKVVFEMVSPEPQSAVSPPQQSEPAEAAEPELNAEKIEEIDPLEIPEPEPPQPDPQPEPQPAPPEPAPAPEPTPKPAPKKIEKKPEQKTISFEEWKKKNKKTSQKKPTKRPQQKPVKIGKITSQTSNIDSLARNPRPSAGPNAGAVVDVLAAYSQEILMLAKRNWKVPTISSDSLYARVAFNVSRLGAISNVRIVESSGDDDFDKSVIQVLKAITIPAPPDNKPHAISITFTAK